MTIPADLQDIVYAIAASPQFAKDQYCFAAKKSGLYRSENGGKTWEFTFTTLEMDPPPTMAIAISPDFEHDQTLFVGAPGGVLRSADAGAHWAIQGFPLPPPIVSSLAMSPNFPSDSILLAGTLDNGVFRTANQGQSWTAWNFGLLDLRVLCLAVSPNFGYDETLYIGTESGLYRSTNGGRAWRGDNLSKQICPDQLSRNLPKLYE